MSEGKHTPGPWDCVQESVFALDETGTCNRFFARVVPGYKRRAQGWDTHEKTGDGEVKANARLIAAAPELLEETTASATYLDEAANLLEGHGLTGCAKIMRKQAEANRAAIAKARGQA